MIQFGIEKIFHLMANNNLKLFQIHTIIFISNPIIRKIHKKWLIKKILVL